MPTLVTQVYEALDEIDKKYGGQFVCYNCGHERGDIPCEKCGSFEVGLIVVVKVFGMDWDTFKKKVFG